MIVSTFKLSCILGEKTKIKDCPIQILLIHILLFLSFQAPARSLPPPEKLQEL